MMITLFVVVVVVVVMKDEHCLGGALVASSPMRFLRVAFTLVLPHLSS